MKIQKLIPACKDHLWGGTKLLAEKLKREMFAVGKGAAALLM